VECERSATTLLLGLSGLVLLAVPEYEGELEQAVETTADLVGCPGRDRYRIRWPQPGQLVEGRRDRQGCGRGHGSLPTIMRLREPT
jgi:hypothetical protein